MIRSPSDFQVQRRPRRPSGHKHLAFADWFGLSPAQTGVLVALYEARGAWIGRRELAHSAEVAIDAIRQRVSELRKALNAEAIDSDRTLGYRLTDAGQRECTGALWEMVKTYARLAEELNGSCAAVPA